MGNVLTKDELKTIRDISIKRILNLPENGRDIKIRCVFHEERTPSMVIYSGNSYNCFGCGKNGHGAIDFCTDLGLSFNDTLKELVNYL